MKIKEVLKEQVIISQIEELEFSKLTFNSKDVQNNTLFVCKGANFKRDYLIDAIDKGAIAYVSEIDYQVNIPLVLVKDIRLSMIDLANAFYDFPQHDLKLIGITGTKGKTTTAYLIKQILNDQIGLLSSVETFDGLESKDAVLTTPEYFDIIKHFRNGVNHDLEYFVLEVSSQALKVNRVSSLTFEVGIFLNISPDHISDLEHPDFEDYFNSKLALFKQTKNAIINLDTPHHQQILEAAQMSEKVISFSKEDRTADYFVHDIENHKQFSRFKINNETFELGMMGDFNVENAVAAIISSVILGVNLDDIRKNLRDVRVPGRMELFVSDNQKLKIIVDYAHNSLSFKKLFHSIEQDYPQDELVIIFGCPGNKALNRRRDLGVVANLHADKVYLCMEDPGYQDPLEIAQEVAMYLTEVDYEIIHDRKEALEAAINQVKKDTVILFTGKGAERFQSIKGRKVQVQSDVSITQELIEKYNQKQND